MSPFFSIAITHKVTGSLLLLFPDVPEAAAEIIQRRGGIGEEIRCISVPALTRRTKKEIYTALGLRYNDVKRNHGELQVVFRLFYYLQISELSFKKCFPRHVLVFEKKKNDISFLYLAVFLCSIPVSFSCQQSLVCI